MLLFGFYCDLLYSCFLPTASLGRDPSGRPTGGGRWGWRANRQRSRSIQYRLSRSRMTSSSAESLKTKKKNHQRNCARGEVEDFPSGCSRADKQCCGSAQHVSVLSSSAENYRLPFIFFSSPPRSLHTSAGTHGHFSLNWRSHSPNSFEFSYGSRSRMLEAKPKKIIFTTTSDFCQVMKRFA